MEGYKEDVRRRKGSNPPCPLSPRLATLAEGQVDRKRYGGHLCLLTAAGDMNQRVLPFYEPEAQGRAKSRAWSGKVLRIESEWKTVPPRFPASRSWGVLAETPRKISWKGSHREFRTEVPGPLMQESMVRRAP